MKRFFLIVIFALFIAPLKAQQEPQVIDRVVAVVGQNVILQSDITIKKNLFINF